jgi:hypothetical protein
MPHERDLFRAIVLSGVALVSAAPGCSGSTPAADTGTAANDAAANDAAVIVADAGADAAPVTGDAATDDAGDAWVAIL